MENKEVNFEEIRDEKKVSTGKKVLKVLKNAGIGLFLIGVGAVGGYIGRKILDKEVYADAAEQRAWRERRAANNNN